MYWHFMLILHHILELIGDMMVDTFPENQDLMATKQKKDV